jgi:hypothetical protein
VIVCDCVRDPLCVQCVCLYVCFVCVVVCIVYMTVCMVCLVCVCVSLCVHVYM